MNSPTFGEARPVWRPSGDVETYVPQISAAERLARARQAGAPPPAPPLPLESTRRRGHGSAAPARREREEAESSSAAPSPRPAPPPAAEKPPEKPAGKPPAATQKRGNASTGTTQAILDVLADAGRPMWAKEVAAALEGHANVGVLMAGLRKRGALVQDVQPGPYRLPDAKPRQATVPAPEDTHANLARLVKQLRDERDTARAELAELRARWRVMAREMHLLAAPWGEEGR